MRKDDDGTYEKAAFLCLLTVTGTLLLFSLFRLTKHFQAAQAYRPLQVFYAVLCLFLTRRAYSVRVFYYLSHYLAYPTLLYYTLDIPPVALIYCVSGIVCYIWYHISRQELSVSFHPDFVEDPGKQEVAARWNFALTAGLISVCLATFWLSFLLLYLLRPDFLVE